ncbi:unnamed protein product [Coregonus sp. 'balchen']|nr:unnamed protein product [Coregonus sp. 'balchen']
MAGQQPLPPTGLGCTAAQGLSSDPLPSLKGLNLGRASHQSPSNNIPPSMVQLQYSHQGCLSSLPTPPVTNQGPSALLPCLNQGPHIPHSNMGPYISHNSPPPSTLLPLKQGPPPSGPPSMIPSTNQGPQNTVAPPVSSSSPYPYPNQGFVNGPPVTLTSPNQGPPNSSFSTMSPCGNQGQQCSHRYPPQLTSPVQQQPQWALPQQHYNHSGVMYKPGATSQPVQEGTNMQPSCPSPGDSGVSSPSSPSSESRYGLHPQLLPSAVRVMEEDRTAWEGKVFVSKPNSSLPPLATTDCVMEDRGNCSPRFILSTSYCVPCEGQTALQSHLPLGALVAPLARLHTGERPLSVCMEADTVKGCGECGAYMCSAMGWQDCGQRFYCPFCGKLCEALRGGQLELISQQLRSLLTSLNREEGAVQSDVRVGLMTYDSRIHLYDLSPALSRPHMLVVTETEDLQLPRIPLFSAEFEEASGVLLELPVKAGLAILKEVGCPGKLLVFHTAPFTEGTHTHNSSGFFSSNKPKSLFQPPDHAVSLAKECVSQGCGVHLFVFAQQNVGGAWPGHVPYLTDLRVSGCYGSFVPGPNPAHVAMATLDWRTTLAVELTHSRALDEKRGVVVQTVLSYTSQQGERRTRVHSLSLCCSHHLLDTFCNCQAQTLLTFYCKKMVLPQYLGALPLILPQYLKALPVYLNSLRKSEVLLPGLRSSVHQRLQLRSQVVSMDTKTTAGHFYPLLLPLPVGDDTSSPPCPLSLGEAVRCTAASLDPGGLHLVHGPLVLLLWVGHNISNTSLVQLFNITCLSTLPSGETKLPVLDNPLSVSVRSLIDTLNSQTPYTRKLRVVKQGDSCEEALQRLLLYWFLKEEEEARLAALREEEEARLAALREEEEEKGKMIAREMKNIQDQISSLTKSITALKQELQKRDVPFLKSYKHIQRSSRAQYTLPDPQLVSGALIDVFKHLGNLQFRVWEKVQGIVKYTPVILDPNTAARWLSLSDDLTSVKHLGKRQQLPDNPERNTICTIVLGSEGFSSGKHSWEVEVGDYPYWHIGVAKESINRKGEASATPEYGYWAINQSSGQYWARHETLTLKRRPQRIRVQLDYDRGEVSIPKT